MDNKKRFRNSEDLFNEPAKAPKLTFSNLPQQAYYQLYKRGLIPHQNEKTLQKQLEENSKYERLRRAVSASQFMGSRREKTASRIGNSLFGVFVAPKFQLPSINNDSDNWTEETTKALEKVKK